MGTDSHFPHLRGRTLKPSEHQLSGLIPKRAATGTLATPLLEALCRAWGSVPSAHDEEHELREGKGENQAVASCQLLMLLVGLHLPNFTPLRHVVDKQAQKRKVVLDFRGSCT